MNRRLIAGFNFAPYAADSLRFNARTPKKLRNYFFALKKERIFASQIEKLK